MVGTSMWFNRLLQTKKGNFDEIMSKSKTEQRLVMLIFQRPLIRNSRVSGAHGWAAYMVSSVYR
jgi:hypothetical protein